MIGRRTFFASVAAVAVAPKLVAADIDSQTMDLARRMRRYSETPGLKDFEARFDPLDPMSHWDRANMRAWQRHIRKHELAMERVSNRA